MQGEADLVAAILARLDALSIALEEDSGELGMLPADVALLQKAARAARTYIENGVPYGD